MSKNYNPRKRLQQIWNKCKNPFNLIISYEDDSGRYILTDSSRTFGRILDPKNSTIYCSTYVLNIFKNTTRWHKYTGNQDLLYELIKDIKQIWDNDKTVKDFHLEDYIGQ
jgi:hypothetical protein